MKGSYFGFGIVLLSYNMHLFLLNSQTIRSMIHFSKPLLCVTLICGDRSHFHFISPVMPDKAAFVQFCFVYSFNGETAIFTAPKAAPSGKE